MSGHMFAGLKESCIIDVQYKRSGRQQDMVLYTKQCIII